MSPRLLVVVRHGDALARAGWERPDEERPLTKKGERQAEALGADLLAHAPARLLTSPALRCAATLAPLAARVGLPLEREPLLAEGTAPEVALARLLDLAGDHASRGAVLACSHGDVVDGLLGALAGRGVSLTAAAAHRHPVLVETPKAGRWELTVEGREVLAGRLVDPPEVGRHAPGATDPSVRPAR